ncbi:MAG TPA: SpoIIE family protein phosphatase [Bryobacteraceae bacterium]|nr:SpoIIE family protein phosphatase [Bryobacteraceae bacterium]
MTAEQKLILVVDDTPLNISVITGALKDTYRTKVATNGAKALAIAAAIEKPDLILLDVVMPEMDGYEVCRRLKTDPATREIPVIFLTAQTEAEDETRGFEVGAVDYVHKPFSPAVVKARVQTHLALRETREKLAQQLSAIQKELETARLIQQSILPETAPQIDGLDIAARYLPMASVAGDFYDFVVVDNKHVGILVADVSGHGMPAALIASMLKIALAAQSGHADDPARVLHGLNQALCGKFQHHYVTAAYAFVDMEKRKLTYAGAGHPPMLMWGTTSPGIREVAENGLFLGKFSFANYTSVEVQLDAGDRCLLYTDGVSEANNPEGAEFGSERLRPFLEAEKNGSANELADRLLKEVERWAARGRDEDLDDDLTFVTVRLVDAR